MLVRQKIGPNAGQIVDMPYHYAMGCIKAGTADQLEDADIAAMPERTPVPTEGYGMMASSTVPAGYVVQEDPVQGWNVLDAGGVQIHRQPFPNLAAARSYAHEHALAQQAVPPDVAKAVMAARVEAEAARAEEAKARDEALERAARQRRVVLGGEEGEGSPTGEGIVRDTLGPKPGDDRGARDRVPPARPGQTQGPRPKE